MKDKSLLSFLARPIFKEDQPESGGWKWHKWDNTLESMNQDVNTYMMKKVLIMCIVLLF